jgi:CspA family cold shock protein
LEASAVAIVEQRLEGKVKWFNNKKGYGFILSDEDIDVFVHHTAIHMEGFRTLRQGDSVVYELHDTDKGPQAQNVQPFDE